MIVSDYKDVTIINADKNKYLALKNASNSEELIGKPIRIIFSNEMKIPELEERNLINQVNM